MANKYNIGKVYISTRKNKKYMVKNPDGKMIHFGGKGYADFTGHQDEKRRENFKKRNKKWATAEKWTPAWLSYHILWN
jgi:hypothetical protein